MEGLINERREDEEEILSGCENEQEEDRTHDVNRNRVVGVVMSCLSNLIFVSFTIYILYLCFQDYCTHSWHKACSTVGILLLMAQAVMVISPDSLIGSKLSHKGRVRTHMILLAAAAGSTLAGFAVIVILKNEDNEKHFHSWHAINGLVLIICMGLASFVGVLTLYSLKLKKIIKPAKLKLIHNLTGIITFLIGVIVEISALYTDWFNKHSTPTIRVICIVFLVLAAICTIEGALKSAYSRFKSLYQGI